MTHRNSRRTWLPSLSLALQIHSSSLLLARQGFHYNVKKMRAHLHNLVMLAARHPHTPPWALRRRSHHTLFWNKRPSLQARSISSLDPCLEPLFVDHMLLCVAFPPPDFVGLPLTTCNYIRASHRLRSLKLFNAHCRPSSTPQELTRNDLPSPQDRLDQAAII
jgi:hypothetical protein